MGGARSAHPQVNLLFPSSIHAKSANTLYWALIGCSCTLSLYVHFCSILTAPFACVVVASSFDWLGRLLHIYIIIRMQQRKRTGKIEDQNSHTKKTKRLTPKNSFCKLLSDKLFSAFLPSTL